MKFVWKSLLSMVLALALVGCTAIPTLGPDVGQSQEATPTLLPETEGQYGEAQPFVDQAVVHLVKDLGVGADKVTVQEVTPAEFPDASLGVPEPDKVYAQVITPGYIIRLMVDGKSYEYHAGDKRVVRVPEEQDPPVMPSREEQPTYQRIEVEESMLSVEVPVGWFRLDPEWVWTSGPESKGRVGVKWVDLQPPMEPQAVLLPQPSQVLASEEVELSWGRGRYHTLEVYAPATQGGNAKASVDRVETHVIVVVTVNGVRRAFDLYASAPTVGELDALQPVLLHMRDTSVLVGAEQSDISVAASDIDTANWLVFSGEELAFQFKYPADWIWKEVPAEGPGAPDDWPVVRVVQLFPQGWAEQLDRSGPSDPTVKLLVPPLSVEVCLGSVEQFRRAYAEPARSETIQVNGIQVTVEYEGEATAQVVRYVFQNPRNVELRVSLVDNLSGFEDRLAGNQALVDLLPFIVASFQFIQ